MAILCLGYDKAAHGLPLCQINTPAEPLDVEISRAGGKPLAEVTSPMHEPRVDHERQMADEAPRHFQPLHDDWRLLNSGGRFKNVETSLKPTFLSIYLHF